MLIRNDTPFAALGFAQLHRDGARMGVVAARATYALSRDGALTPAAAPALITSVKVVENRWMFTVAS